MIDEQKRAFQILQQTIAFRHLPETELSRIAATGRLVNFKAEEKILYRGEVTPFEGNLWCCFQNDTDQNDLAAGDTSVYVMREYIDPAQFHETETKQQVELPYRRFQSVSNNGRNGNKAWLFGELEDFGSKRNSTVVAAQAQTLLQFTADCMELEKQYETFRAEFRSYWNENHREMASIMNVRSEIVLSCYVLSRINPRLKEIESYKNKPRIIDIGRLDRGWLSSVCGSPESTIGQLLRRMVENGVLGKNGNSYYIETDAVDKLREIYAGKEQIKATRPAIKGALRKDTIILILPSLAMMFSHLAVSISNYLQERDCRVMIVTVDENPETERKEIEMAIDSGVRAIVLVAVEEEAPQEVLELMQEAHAKKITLIEVDRIHTNLPSSLPVHQFELDNEHAGEQAFVYLHAQGCRRFYAVMDNKNYASSRRAAGFKKGAAEHGMTAEILQSEQRSRKAGEEGAIKLMRLGSFAAGELVGIFGANDAVCSGIMEILGRPGEQLDYRIVGVDSAIPEYGRLLRIPSYKQDFEEWGRRIGQLIWEAYHSPTPPQTIIEKMRYKIVPEKSND